LAVGPYWLNGKLSWSQYTPQERQLAMLFVQRANTAAQQAYATGNPFMKYKISPAVAAQALIIKNAWIRANQASKPGGNYIAGHIPDTVWTNVPNPPGGFMWLPLKMNASFGGAANGYPQGYVVTGFNPIWTP
jgi:hypothetical protein